MAETYSNEYLNLEQMTGNAQIILDTMLGYGWTKESICGMLGNIQSESTMNPGLWESRIPNNWEHGFGLVQWTPSGTVYLPWAQENGYTTYDQYGRIAPQCQRIKYELDNGLQWIAKPAYPMSFQEFVSSTLSPDYLAEVFINNYERPLDTNQPIRGEQALYWYNNLTGGTSNSGLPKYLELNGNQLIGRGGKAYYLKATNKMWISVHQSGSQTTGWGWPAPGYTEADITSYFGWRTNPITGQMQFHNGIDIAGTLDSNIVSTNNGVILNLIANDPSGGNFIIIQHDNNFTSRYLHLNGFADGLSVGNTVTRGQTIGYMGTTGSSTGVHLHFEIRLNGEPQDPLNYVQTDTSAARQLEKAFSTGINRKM